MNKENISKVYLLSVPLDSSYKNTLYFSSKSAQQSYFETTIKKSYTGFTYLRKDNLIYVPDHIDNIYNANYVMYQNSYYDNKWFYAFIKDMKYESDDCTIIEIETDVIQTWLHDYKLKESFVEREHVFNDVEGENTVPEGLETGEYVCNNKIEDENGKDLFIYMAYSDYTGENGDVKGNKYGGIYSGMGYSAFNNTSDGIASLNRIIADYDDAKADAINSIFIGPRWVSGRKADSTFVAASVGPSDSPQVYNPNGISKPTKINGYNPRNKKLLCYPYSYLTVSNNAGSSVVYKYEDFRDEKCNFEVSGVLTPGCSIRMNPLWYKGAVINNDEGINAGKYPICCWNSDTYTNWLTQNGVNIGISAVSGIATGVLGGIAIATGVGAVAGASMIASGVGMVANSIAQVDQQSKVPDQVKGNTNCGDVITGNSENCFMFYQMSIKKEYAQIIDSYMDMFGYKVNRVKVPESNHMSRYWYTKTIDANITGDIPTNDLNKIRSCYDNGITFWKSASNMYVYPSTNDDGSIKNSNR